MDIAIYFVTVVGQNGLELPQYQADPLDFVNRFVVMSRSCDSRADVTHR